MDDFWATGIIVAACIFILPVIFIIGVLWSWNLVIPFCYVIVENRLDSLRAFIEALMWPFTWTIRAYNTIIDEIEKVI